MFNPKNEFLGYITSSGGLGVEYNLKVRGVKLFNFVDDNTDSIEWVYENERDIKPMIYPCYEDKTSTVVMEIHGVCISEPSNTNILYIYQLEYDQYQNFLNAWTGYTHNPEIVYGFNKLIVYNDGTIIDSIYISSFIGVSVAEWNYNSGDVGLYPSGGIGECIGQMHIHVPGNTNLSTKYTNTFKSLFSNNNYPLLPGDSAPVYEISAGNGLLPTIDEAFRNFEVWGDTNKYAECTILIKFDFNKQLYYMDVSFSLTIPNRNGIKMVKNAFMNNFYVTIGFHEISTVGIYPFNDRELLNTFELNDNSATISFRIYETNKVPFNVNGNNMYLSITCRLDSYFFYKVFNVSSCLIQSDHESYQNWLFHYVPCIENKDIVSGVTPSMGLNSYYSLSTGTFSNDSTGLKLIYTVNDGSTNIYAASWPATGHSVNLYNSDNVYTGTCIVSSAVIVFNAGSTGTEKFAIPFNFSNSVFPLVPMFDLTRTSNVVGRWYLLHYSQNVNYGNGNYVYSMYDGYDISIITGNTYKNVYNDALNRSDKAPIYVGFRPSTVQPINGVIYDIRNSAYKDRDDDSGILEYAVIVSTLKDDLLHSIDCYFAIWLVESDILLSSVSVNNGETYNLTFTLDGNYEAGRPLCCGFIPNNEILKDDDKGLNYRNGRYSVQINIPSNLTDDGKTFTMTVDVEINNNYNYKFTIKSFVKRIYGTTSYLLHGINIKYVDMSYLNDITHNNLYF
jgi:hypothetical protein